MKKVDYNKYLEKAYDSFDNGGAFLTVKNEDELNTMTIGWGSVGIIWRTPMLMVLVRESRHTFKLINNTDEFTVSIPFGNKMQDELLFCGTKSGREYDKFKECNLETINGNILETPLIKGCDLHYECTIEYSQPMDSDRVNSKVLKNCYPENDLHTMYFGEIKNCFKS
mgnify:FL=1